MSLRCDGLRIAAICVVGNSTYFTPHEPLTALTAQYTTVAVLLVASGVIFMLVFFARKGRKAKSASTSSIESQPPPLMASSFQQRLREAAYFPPEEQDQPPSYMAPAHVVSIPEKWAAAGLHYPPEEPNRV